MRKLERANLKYADGSAFNEQRNAEQRLDAFSRSNGL